MDIDRNALPMLRKDMGKVGKKWNAIVLTCQNKESAYAYQQELEIRQRKGYIDKDVLILTIEDPKSHVGSGGATLNALLVVAEHISAKMGYTVINPDLLQDSHILIMHMLAPGKGRHFPYDSCGRSFFTLPVKRKNAQFDGLYSNIDSLIDTMTYKIAVNSPPGLWVCSTDMFLSVPNTTGISWNEPIDVHVIAVPGTNLYAKQHGVYKINGKGTVDDIIYMGDSEAIDACCLQEGIVPLVGGIVYFSVRMAERMLSFHVMPPLDACTYMGLDSGTKPIELSLFFDVLLAMCIKVTQEDFVSGKRSGIKGKPSDLPKDQAVTMRNARNLLWRELRDFTIKAAVIRGASHSYMDMAAVSHHKHLLLSPLKHTDEANLIWNNVTHSYMDKSIQIDHMTVVLNSYIEKGVKIGPKSALVHCHLRGDICVAKESILSGINTMDTKFIKTKLEFQESIVMQAFNIHLPTLGGSSSKQRVLTILGKYDNVQAPMWRGTSTYCNTPWVVFLTRTGITKEDLWDTDLEDDKKCILNARLFPLFHAEHYVGMKEILWLQGKKAADPKEMLERWRSSWRLSLGEILQFIDMSAEFKWRRELFFQVAQLEVQETLMGGKDRGHNDLFRSAAVEGYQQQMLETLDLVAYESESAGIAARTLGNIADMLGCMAEDKGGLRSGPAGNQAWQKAFQYLENGQIPQGIRAMAKERSRGGWLDRPDLLVRAARHYEGAAQILIRHAVKSARQFISTTSCEMSPMGKWVVAECPARVDISGGWSDTPPITYEHGGAVVNAAVTLDGKKPIGASVMRIPAPKLVLVIGADGGHSTKLILREMSDLDDYAQPHSPGSLLKAAFICADIIQYDSVVSLEDQLKTRYGGGFELYTWSHLPHGSGLGTSSILAGGVIAVLWRASGRKFDIKSLNHAVLHLEQMLTTGGGWQDQVGGLTGGIKIGHSKAELPLFVDTTVLNVREETMKAFSDRLVMVYTGKTRLARNLLQNVIRNWYSRNPEIVETENALVKNAWDCAKAFEQGDLAKVGACMDLYWIQKKKMAPGCEPLSVAQMMEALRPYVYGMTLAGAGGGGFLYVLTREPNSVAHVKDIISKIKGTEGVTIHAGCVDKTGMSLTIQDDWNTYLETHTTYTAL